MTWAVWCCQLSTLHLMHYTCDVHLSFQCLHDHISHAPMLNFRHIFNACLTTVALFDKTFVWRESWEQKTLDLPSLTGCTQACLLLCWPYLCACRTWQRLLNSTSTVYFPPGPDSLSPALLNWSALPPNCSPAVWSVHNFPESQINCIRVTPFHNWTHSCHKNMQGLRNSYYLCMQIRF